MRVLRPAFPVGLTTKIDYKAENIFAYLQYEVVLYQ